MFCISRSSLLKFMQVVQNWVKNIIQKQTLDSMILLSNVSNNVKILCITVSNHD